MHDGQDAVLHEQRRLHFLEDGSGRDVFALAAGEEGGKEVGCCVSLVACLDKDGREGSESVHSATL